MKANKISNHDAIDWLKSLDSSSVDCIITDPPYESLEKHRYGAESCRRLKTWFDNIPNTLFPKLFSEFYRVLKPNSHCYVMCDHETMFVMKPIAEQAGFKFWKPLIWDKVHIGMGYHYRARYEVIMFFEKGKRKLNDLSIPDILVDKMIKNGYPTEKPVRIFETLVKQSTNEGEFVIDPFCGSGSVGVAAVRLNRKFLGNDISPDAVKLAQNRINNAINVRLF